VTSQPTKKLVLASGSPRRRELLDLTGLAFEIATTDIDETPHPGEAADAYTLRLSQAKAHAARPMVTGPALILAADTTVADGDSILGKPADPAEARAMLGRLRGRTHQVYTAITLLDAASDQARSELAVTNVPMREYRPDEVEAYIASGDPFDKAGGYAIQHRGFHPVELRSGCFANVVGLPLCHLLRALRAFGIEPGADVPARCQQHHAYECDVTGDILAAQDDTAC
jgi:septum formation protein